MIFMKLTLTTLSKHEAIQSAKTEGRNVLFHRLLSSSNAYRKNFFSEISFRSLFQCVRLDGNDPHYSIKSLVRDFYELDGTLSSLN